MKKLALIVLMVTFVFSCKTEPELPPLPPGQYEVTIMAKGVFNGLRAHLSSKNERNRDVFLDTAMVLNEQAVFRGSISRPTIQNLTINGVKGQLPFVLETGRTIIEVNKDSLISSKIDGGPSNVDYSFYRDEVRYISETLTNNQKLMLDARNAGDLEKFNEINNQSQALAQKQAIYSNTFIEEHPESEFSLLLLENILRDPNTALDHVKANKAILQSVITKNAGTQNIGKKIDAYIAQKEAQANLDIGKIAPNFSAPDPDGNMIALNDIKGKATIIDFWASWCGPCRRENPNVVRVYEKYHDKGLEIISISLDRPNQQSRWLQAIEKDNLIWHHVSNLQYFNDPVARMYNVSAIPATFILDADGRIVAKRLRGPALEEQIASMLN